MLQLAKITGHKNLKELLTYYEESAEEMAKRLGVVERATDCLTRRYLV